MNRLLFAGVLFSLVLAPAYSQTAIPNYSI